MKLFIIRFLCIGVLQRYENASCRSRQRLTSYMSGYVFLADSTIIYSKNIYHGGTPQTYMLHIYYLIRMHRIGDPSAPTNLRGKQWIEYIPAGTSLSFRASTRMIS